MGIVVHKGRENVQKVKSRNGRKIYEIVITIYSRRYYHLRLSWGVEKSEGPPALQPTTSYRYYQPTKGATVHM